MDRPGDRDTVESDMTGIGTIVVVGASLAGVKAAEGLRAEGYEGRIVLFGEEPELPYERPPLSKTLLRGEGDPDQAFVHPEGWYAEHRVDLEMSTRVRAIDPAAREVALDGGRRVGFDRLLIATGSAPRRLDIAGGDLAGVHYLRTLDDARTIREAAAGARRAIVVGGGWIGSEVAASMRQLGVPVTMVADGAVPLERVLGPEVGAVYLDLHAEHGVELAMNQRAAAFLGTGSVEAVETADGTRIEGDLVVVGAGARPRVQLAVEAGLDVGDGILVDEHLETSAPGIYAAGDVAEAWHPVLQARIRVEHWDNARRQGRAVAANMLGRPTPYVRIPYFYSDQYDLSMEYAGYAPSWDRVVFRGDPASRSFIAFWLADGRVVAGMNANVQRVNAKIGALVGSREKMDAGRLADPEVPLDDITALSARAETAAS
jgi:3-phenylpropionate/trans-cinnamate dioxygenase ferredoxin reductase subunit